MEYDRQLDLALAETDGDPDLRAQALAAKAVERCVRRSVAAATRLRRGRSRLVGLRGARGPEVERRVLYALGWTSAMRGRAARRALHAVRPRCLRRRSTSRTVPARVAGQRLVWRGEVSEARVELTGLLALADERGEPSSYALCVCICASSSCGLADGSRRRGCSTSGRSPSEAELLAVPHVRALPRAARRGPRTVDRARRWAARAIDTRRGDELSLGLARGGAGAWDGGVARADPPRAAESLRVVWEHCLPRGGGRPGVFPVAPDLVEALVELGEPDEAIAVIARLRELSEQQQHPVGTRDARAAARRSCS